MNTLAILHSTVRAEEKLLLEAARGRGLRVKLVDVRGEIFDPAGFRPDFDAALERSVSTVKGDYTAAFLEDRGVPVLNPSRIARV